MLPSGMGDAEMIEGTVEEEDESRPRPSRHTESQNESSREGTQWPLMKRLRMRKAMLRPTLRGEEEDGGQEDVNIEDMGTRGAFILSKNYGRSRDSVAMSAFKTY